MTSLSPSLKTEAALVSLITRSRGSQCQDALHFLMCEAKHIFTLIHSNINKSVTIYIWTLMSALKHDKSYRAVVKLFGEVLHSQELNWLTFAQVLFISRYVYSYQYQPLETEPSVIYLKKSYRSSLYFTSISRFYSM